MSGNIPESIGNLANLIDLWLRNNQLSGSIPESIGNLANLKELRLRNNQLCGSIPESIGNLANLERLDLDNNQLSGSIPESIGNLANLKVLYLDYNQLSGNIPESIGNLTKLIYLCLHYNQLSDNIPESLGNLANLEYLYLDNNQLSGSIPESMEKMVALKYLHLQNNQLTGIIPSGIFKLPNLVEFLYDKDKLKKEDEDVVTVNIPPNNEIWYTSTTGKIIELERYPYELVSNTYENGIGKYKFAQDVIEISNYFGSLQNSKEVLAQFKSITLPSGIKNITSYFAMGNLVNASSIILPENLETIGTDFIGGFGRDLSEKHLYFLSKACPYTYGWSIFWNQSSTLYVHYPKGSDYSSIESELKEWQQESPNFKYEMVETSYNLIHN